MRIFYIFLGLITLQACSGSNTQTKSPASPMAKTRNFNKYYLRHEYLITAFGCYLNWKSTPLFTQKAQEEEKGYPDEWMAALDDENILGIRYYTKSVKTNSDTLFYYTKKFDVKDIKYYGNTRTSGGVLNSSKYHNQDEYWIIRAKINGQEYKNLLLINFFEQNMKTKQWIVVEFFIKIDEDLKIEDSELFIDDISYYEAYKKSGYRLNFSRTMRDIYRDNR
jgi:hypothetical protein